MATAHIASDRAQYRNRLREARESAGISMDKLQELSGVAKPTIWGIDKGHWPTETVRVKLANALNVNAGWLFWVEGEDGEVPKR